MRLFEPLSPCMSRRRMNQFMRSLFFSIFYIYCLCTITWLLINWARQQHCFSHKKVSCISRRQYCYLSNNYFHHSFLSIPAQYAYMRFFTHQYLFFPMKKQPKLRCFFLFMYYYRYSFNHYVINNSNKISQRISLILLHYTNNVKASHIKKIQHYEFSLIFSPYIGFLSQAKCIKYIGSPPYISLFYGEAKLDSLYFFVCLFFFCFAFYVFLFVFCIFFFLLFTLSVLSLCYQQSKLVKWKGNLVVSD